MVWNLERETCNRESLAHCGIPQELFLDLHCGDKKAMSTYPCHHIAVGSDSERKQEEKHHGKYGIIGSLLLAARAQKPLPDV